MTTGDNNFWTSHAVPLIDPETLSSVIAAASDIALVVDAATMIQSVIVNPAAEEIGPLSHWEGRPLAELLSDDSIDKFQAAHQRLLEGESRFKPLELNHEDRANWRFPVRYSIHPFGPDGTALYLGRDLRNSAARP